MEKCGDLDDCISTTEAAELAAKLDENESSSLPIPGQVDFINGGPPCQVCLVVVFVSILLIIGLHDILIFELCVVPGFLWNE